MDKLKLTVDELRVTSFDTEANGGGRGTVAAQGLSGLTCPRCPTVPTRDGTCCTP